jgi:hypothetical protein
VQGWRRLAARHCPPPPAWSPPPHLLSNTLLPADAAAALRAAAAYAPGHSTHADAPCLQGSRWPHTSQHRARDATSGALPNAAPGPETRTTFLALPDASEQLTSDTLCPAGDPGRHVHAVRPGTEELVEAGGAAGHPLLQPLHAYIHPPQTFWSSPTRTRQTVADLWEQPHQLRAFIDAAAATSSGDALSCSFRHCSTSAALLVVSCLSHPHPPVAAAVAHFLLTAPHRLAITLLPVLAWRLRAPICANTSPLISPPLDSHTAPQSWPSAVPPVASLCCLLQELPAPCEVLCLPHALLQLHSSVWAHADVLAAALAALERVLGAFGARFRANVALAEPLEAGGGVERGMEEGQNGMVGCAGGGMGCVGGATKGALSLCTRRPCPCRPWLAPPHIEEHSIDILMRLSFSKGVGRPRSTFLE